jgi:ABC-type antimicrobial peptide transport system permease subunit
MPGIDSATFSAFGMLSGSNSQNRIEVPGYTAAANEVPSARGVLGGPHFFGTTGIPILRGQSFDAPHGAGAVALVNQTMATRYFGGDAIGRRFTVRGWSEFEIVGVVADTKYRTIRETATPTYYAPMFQEPPYQGISSGARIDARFAVRSRSVRAVTMVPSIVKTAGDVDPQVQVVEMQTMNDVVDSQLAQERLVATLAGGFGAVALLLAAIGLYGVLSYVVARRTREIGVRLALGATPGRVFRSVIGTSVIRVVVGVGCGLVLSLTTLPLVRSLLFGLEPADAPTLFGAVMALLVVGIVASWVPARRAAGVDPMTAIRE